MQTTKRWLEAGLALALWAALSAPLAAGEAKSFPTHYRFSGQIEKGDAARFIKLFQLNGIKTVMLDSPGGLVSEALQIATFIQSNGVATHVPEKATCASACVLLLAGGVIRSASPSARIGIHMGSGLLNERAENVMEKMFKKHGATGVTYAASIFEQQAAISTLKQVDFFLSAGVSIRLIRAASEIDHLDIRWLDSVEQADYNLINSKN